MKQPLIQLHEAGLIYSCNSHQVAALERITLAIYPRESWAIIGPSGCGKTSLLFLLAGLRQPSWGEVLVGGFPVTSPRAETALILQDYGLFPWKNVYQNASLGLEIRGFSKKQQEEVALPILEELGLKDCLSFFPSQLSGGQRQRVAIARALALHPDLLLMDEPLSALDALTREGLQRLLLKIWKRQNLTVVLVTHSIEEAVYLGQKILVLSPGPGRIVSVVENPLVGEKGFRRSPEFHQQCILLRGILEEGGEGDT